MHNAMSGAKAIRRMQQGAALEYKKGQASIQVLSIVMAFGSIRRQLHSSFKSDAAGFVPADSTLPKTGQMSRFQRTGVAVRGAMLMPRYQKAGFVSTRPLKSWPPISTFTSSSSIWFGSLSITASAIGAPIRKPKDADVVLPIIFPHC